ncbi:MAG TPA: hypothetical protein VI977_04300 [archaeon]|nr:hypothetical protein [archaeon]
MNSKAQASIETISLALIVIVMATAILGYFNAIQNPTIAIGLARATALLAINANPNANFVIDTIVHTEDLASSKITLLITTKSLDGGVVGCTDINAAGIAWIIRQKNLYQTVFVKLNSNQNNC